MNNSKTIVLVLIFCFSNYLFSQKESANWYFGEGAGLNFNTAPPTPLTNGRLNTKEGCAAISDANGNLLFYTDGVRVWDRRHQLMPNGDGLLGHISSTESGLIIPNPSNRNSYYIFTIDEPSYYLARTGDSIDGINFSEVDMTLNNGYGDVVAENKNNHLITYDQTDPTQNEFKSSEKITAVTHSNGNSIWVITQFTNKFYAFEVTNSGVNTTPVISTVPLTINPRVYPSGPNEGANITAIGYLKVSPNGKKIAIAHSSTSLGSPRTGTKKSGKVLIYDFNNSTGSVSNESLLLENEYPYGVEFSPNSKVLYITSAIYNSDDEFVNGLLYQYDLSSSNIINSKTTIRDTETTAGALQLAINGKIYRTGYKPLTDETMLSVINNPNNLGSTCDYYHNSVSLNRKVTKSGLPPFIQSIFLYSFDYKYTCLGDTTEFTISSEDPYDLAVWDFGDGSSSITTSPTAPLTVPTTTHHYPASGSYTVKLTLSINGVEYDPLIKQVKISEPPKVITGMYQLEECDTFDSDPNDGITTFNLTDAIPGIVINPPAFINANFYQSITDAIDDSLNINYINPVYRNNASGELIYAKVFSDNPECYNIVPIELITNSSYANLNYTLEGCDINNSGTSIFDLNSLRSSINSDISEPGITISFHEIKNDAAVGTNELPNNYSSVSKTIYIRIRKDNKCYGGGAADLQVKPFPNVSGYEVTYCTSEFPILIDSGIDPLFASDYNYSWNTLPEQTTNTIQVNSSGVYEVTIIDPSVLGCQKTISVKVNEIQTPQIVDIIINTSNVNIIINPDLDYYEFSIDNEFGSFTTNNEFFNLDSGHHTLYVKDIRDCYIVSQDFDILGFPRYFTPNNDGYNDSWNVVGLESITDERNISMFIFNRYGKLIKEFNPLETVGWDGTYNGNLLQPDDYWYYIEIPDGKSYKGHFSLRR